MPYRNIDDSATTVYFVKKAFLGESMSKLKRIFNRVLCFFHHRSSRYDGSFLICDRCGKSVSDRGFNLHVDIDVLSNKIIWYEL